MLNKLTKYFSSDLTVLVQSKKTTEVLIGLHVFWCAVLIKRQPKGKTAYFKVCFPQTDSVRAFKERHKMGRFREVDPEEQKRLDEEKAKKEQEEKEKADRMKVDDRYVSSEMSREKIGPPGFRPGPKVIKLFYQVK